MNGGLRLAWHFGGLVLAIAGALMLWGIPGAMIMIGIWAMCGVAFDVLIGKIQ